MADPFQVFVRFLHILSGVLWVGGIALWSMLIAPSLAKRLPPQVRGPFMGVVLPRLARYLTFAGVLTVITGFWTMGLIVGFGQIAPVFQIYPYGVALGGGVVLAAAMLANATFIVMPAANRLLEIGRANAAATAASAAAASAAPVASAPMPMAAHAPASTPASTTTSTGAPAASPDAGTASSATADSGAAPASSSRSPETSVAVNPQAPPEVMKLQKRVMTAGLVNLGLGVLALGFMAWAVTARVG